MLTLLPPTPPPPLLLEPMLGDGTYEWTERCAGRDAGTGRGVLGAGRGVCGCDEVDR
jgi:hypothetical protein